MRQSALAMSCGLLLGLGFPAALNAQFTYTTNNGAITITGYTGPGGEVVIPDTIKGLPVVRIGGYAFYYNTAVTGITLPNGIISIGEQAFSHTILTSVTLPNGLVSIGPAAFSACWELASVAMSDTIIWVDPAAFSFCTNLTTLTFPASVWDIEGGKGVSPGYCRIVP